MSEARSFTLDGSGGRPLRGVRYGPEDAPQVVFVHGFKGFKDWGFVPWFAERFAEAGFGAVRFDFSHNGVEAEDFDRLDLFLLDTPQRHQEDLGRLAEAIPGRLALVGHSRGGADALLFAAANRRVETVVTLASVATMDFAPPDWEDVIRARGYYPFPNARTGQEMPVAREAFEAGRRLDLEGATRRLPIPVLCFHAADDPSVPADSMEQLLAWLPNGSGERLPSGGHTFGAVHPFQGPTETLEHIAARTVAHLRTVFG